MGVIAQRSGERPVSHTTNGEASCVGNEFWMFEAAREDWPVFCLDAKHRKGSRPAERTALLGSGLREFVLDGNILAQDNVTRARAKVDAITASYLSLIHI